MNAPLACAATARLLKSPGGSSPAGRRGALTALREPRPVALKAGRPGLGAAGRLAGTAVGLGGRA